MLKERRSRREICTLLAAAKILNWPICWLQAMAKILAPLGSRRSVTGFIRGAEGKRKTRTRGPEADAMKHSLDSLEEAAMTRTDHFSPSLTEPVYSPVSEIAGMSTASMPSVVE